jgi:tryptophan-rich sensory protein
VGNEIGRDVVRQAANVVGALFQAGMTVTASATIQGVVDEGPRSLVEPALYAFTIWALIFVLSLSYAVYQALPSNRENPHLRRVGPFTAAAFFCTGLWSIFVPLRQFGLAQLMLLAIFIFLLIAYLRLSRYARERELGVGERWLVALPLGPSSGG